MLRGSAQTLIQTLKSVHDDLVRAEHFMRVDGKARSTMCLAPFVFECLIYNSLYRLDWTRAAEKASIVPHPRRKTEGERPFDWMPAVTAAIISLCSVQRFENG